MFVKKDSQILIKKGEKVSDDILKIAEMSSRTFNLYFSYASYSLPGQMILIINFRDPNGNILRSVRRDR